jgi:hypothetical protein
MNLKLQNREENMIFEIISDIKKIGNIYQAKIIKGTNENKQQYILNIWIGNLPNYISDGKLIINSTISNFPNECNYNIKPIQDVKCKCCTIIDINKLNRPPLSLLKIDYILSIKTS